MNDLTVILSGGFAGIAQIITGHPFDTVKIRYVDNQNKQNIKKYNRVTDCVKDIRSEGYKNFYRGVSSPMVGSVIMNIQTFYLYSFFNRYFHEDPFISGALTGSVLSIIESPVDLFKSRMQIDPKSKNIIRKIGYRYIRPNEKSYVNIIRNFNYRGIYTGLGITNIRNIFSVGGFFWGYETVKKMFPNEYMGSFVGGAAAGFLCWGPTYPLDVIKTIIQTDTQNEYKGIKDVVTKVYKNYGYRGFWKGFTPCIIRGVFVNPFVFLAYEVGIKHLQ